MFNPASQQTLTCGGGGWSLIVGGRDMGFVRLELPVRFVLRLGCEFREGVGAEVEKALPWRGSTTRGTKGFYESAMVV